MAYRTLKHSGHAPTGQGKQVAMKGLKITTNADVAINKMLPPLASREAKALLTKIREGSAATNNGTYTLNGHVCFHIKFNGQANAVAYRAPINDPYVYVEAILAKTGAGNNYQEL